MKEQRRSQRIRHELVVDMHDKRGARRLHALDVARHGLFLATDGEPPRERHLVQLTVHLPDGEIRAAASVTRHMKGEGGVDGVGVQFFALSDDAKQRWDHFIFGLQRSTSQAPRSAPAPAKSSREGTVPGGATFLVKLKSVERLKDFAATHLASGGTVLFTPVLRAPGEIVTLIVVHPKTDEEFRLPGIIHKAYEDRPKRLEIHFHGITPALLNAFAAYVETGHEPRVQLDPPVRPRAPLLSQEDLDLDVDVFDEDTLDTDDRIAAPNSTPEPVSSASIPPMPSIPPMSSVPSVPAGSAGKAAQSGASTTTTLPASAPLPPAIAIDPGLKPSTYLLRCQSCDAEPYAVDLGPCRGVLGLVADHSAFLSNRTGRVVTAPRLISAEERQSRVQKFLTTSGGRLDAKIDLMTLLGAVALVEPAKDPETGSSLKQTRAVERMEHAARRLGDGAEPAKTKVICAACKEGQLTVEKVSV